jgi:hypothetical protein
MMQGLISLIAREFVLLVIVSSILYPVAALSIERSSLQTDGLTNPLGLADDKPRFSWRLQSSTRNDNQTAYQVQVASTSQLGSRPDLWDSGEVSSSDISVLYGGRQLQSRDVGWWRVRAWDSRGQPSPWSEIGSFEMALLKQSDWNAHWIVNPEYVAEGGTSLPVFAKRFTVECPVEKARLYLLGLGQFKGYLGGLPLSDAVLAPGYSQTNGSLPYSTFDVTEKLRHGDNLLGVELGKGVYDAEATVGKRYTDFITANNPLTLIAQLEIRCWDGRTVAVLSDESWKTSVHGPQIESAWYGGEEYDARKEFPQWPGSRLDTSSWTNASGIGAPPVTGALTADPGPALKIIDRWKAISVNKINDTTWVFDLGTNFAGWYNLTMSGEAGQRVVIWPGEYLTNGLVNQSSSGQPIFDAYTFAGRPSEWYAPRFMYHGFRYLQVDNLSRPPVASDLEALIIRAENEAVSSFETSSTLFNSIHGIIDRSFQSNMYSVLTDCPTREKSGWLEQDQLVIDPVVWGYDIRAYFKRFAETIADSQLTTA